METTRYTIKRILCSLILMTTVSLVNGVIANANPCIIPLSGYESFIKNVPEDTPVGLPVHKPQTGDVIIVDHTEKFIFMLRSVIGKLNVSGSPSEVQLIQQENSFLWLESISRNITLNRTLDTDSGQGTIVMRVNCQRLNTIGAPVISLTVRVLLEDVNDNTPMFSKHHYYVNVSEDSKVGTSVYSGAIATDDDQIGGGNDQISYRILKGRYSDYFDIEYPLYPDIKLKKSLDFETLKYLTIDIEARDNPVRGASLSSTSKITFNVMDVDDLNPAFHSELYIATVSINATVGSMVQVTPPINGTDQDALRAPIVYKLLDPDNAFVIDGATGTVYVNTRLSAPFYAAVLKVIQTDNPLRFGTALLKINVQMTSNKTKGPSFRQQLYKTELSETHPTGTTVLTVPAILGSNGNSVQYSLEENIPEFSIDQRGNLKLMKELDYETKKQYRMTLTASDGASSASTEIQIMVNDVNDNTPTLRNQIIAVTTDRVKGEVLNRIQAQDRDADNHITYTLMNFRELFAVSPSGQLSITGSYDELILDTYYLTIKVEDSGKPPRETFSLVTVKFPYLHRTVGQGAMTPDQSDSLAIVFGAIAAVFLVIIILLVVYIIRRHAHTAEQLNKAKPNKNIDPKGLTYKAGDPSPEPSRLDYDGYMEDNSDHDGCTSVQDNPISENRMAYAFNNPNSGQNDVQIDTAVIPYGKSFNNYEERREYQNGVLKTFHVPEGSSSGESSDSTGDSNRGLMRIHGKSNVNKSKKLSWGSTERINHFDSEESLQGPPNKKSKEKPEITVYF